jgi:hypothetical protein
MCEALDLIPKSAKKEKNIQNIARQKDIMT